MGGEHEIYSLANFCLTRVVLLLINHTKCIFINDNCTNLAVHTDNSVITLLGDRYTKYYRIRTIVLHVS